MSISPRHPLDYSDIEALRSMSYNPIAPTSKDRLIEQKRAEHEQTRLEHRRRFEEQMQMLETKQQRDEAIINGVEEEDVTRASNGMPVTPMRTPSHGDIRSKTTTSTRSSPPLKVFEARHPVNDQLVTPPSDHPTRSGSFGTGRSVPGSRRTSSNLGFESLSIGDSSDTRRASYIEQSRALTHSDNARPSLSKLYNSDDVSANSFLQMNTTDDAFPILVRRGSHAPAMTTVSMDESLDYRHGGQKSALPMGSLSFHRGLPSDAQKGLADELEINRPRPIQEAASQSAHRVFQGNTNILQQYEPIRNAFPETSNSAHSRQQLHNSYAGHASATQPSMLPPTGFPAYGLTQAYGQKYSTYSSYSVGQQELQRTANPYSVMSRPNTYTKRSLEEANRYADVALESLIGDIYSLCKDQHGCRYLQKKLDERNPANVDIIFNETHKHASELMIDPFGNYLCQKLLEHCDDDKRLKVVQIVAPDLINISLNMHGTRAVQKLIEFLTTSEQIRIATEALSCNTVTLIKDLNGNHVIQKCLNRLESAENQFIFDAVTNCCMEVATHRHGCCVLQRCIDHASDKQKLQVITEIISNAPILVQDPFGNYVVQYVLDLGEPRFSNPLIRRFLGNVSTFSTQKFSSNVIEKCLRVAEPTTRALLIDELLHKTRLEKLLRDSFANYVVQTALDYAEQHQRQQLIDCIRPLLPAIRATPYGRRIQSKISGNNPPVGVAGNFSYAPTVSGFPGYGLRMPPVSVGAQTYTALNDYRGSFKSDFEY